MKDNDTFKLRYKGYNKKAISRQILFFTILIGIITIGALSYDSETLNIDSFGWGIIGTSFSLTILQGSMYFRGYAIIKGNLIKRRTLFSNSIDLSTIDSIRKFAGDYKFKSNGQTVGILNYEACEESDLKQLDEIINKNKIEWI